MDYLPYLPHLQKILIFNSLQSGKQITKREEAAKIATSSGGVFP